MQRLSSSMLVMIRMQRSRCPADRESWMSSLITCVLRFEMTDGRLDPRAKLDSERIEASGKQEDATTTRTMHTEG